MRKVIALQTKVVSYPNTPSQTLYALCDDGTMWSRDIGEPGTWAPEEPVPQPSDAAAKLGRGDTEAKLRVCSEQFDAAMNDWGAAAELLRRIVKCADEDWENAEQIIAEAREMLRPAVPVKEPEAADEPITPPSAWEEIATSGGLTWRWKYAGCFDNLMYDASSGSWSVRGTGPSAADVLPLFLRRAEQRFGGGAK